jgi:hypothetical protein
MTTKLSSLAIIVFFLGAPLGLLCTGCGPSSQESMALDRLANAKAMYRQAKSDPHVDAYARPALVDAERTIAAAESAEDWEYMNHLAYLGERKTLIAIDTAKRKMAEQEQKTLSRELEHLRLIEHATPQDPELERREERAAAAEERRQKSMGK